MKVFDLPTRRRFPSIFLGLLIACAVAQAEPSNPSDNSTVSIGDPISAFQLPDSDGKVVDIAPNDETTATVVCFLGTECPLVKLYSVRLNSLQKSLDGKVRFVGVNSNVQDSLDDLKAFASQHELAFPVLKDYQNQIADKFAAKRTPEVFLLDQEFKIRYHGRIDNQYEPGVSRAKATQFDLQTAIDELLAGKPISEPETPPEGCLIGRVPKSNASDTAKTKATYCKEVSRILQSNCVECHRQGEIGPFALDDYDEVVGWGDMMLEVIDEGRMPPWHANPKHGEFINTRAMSSDDKQTLKDWVAAGAPYGDAADLPPKREYISGWQLPKQPEVVVEMGSNEFKVKAEGTVDYQYFVVDPGFTEDKWVAAAEVIPGNRSVVHHSIVFVRPPDGMDFRGLGWIAAYVPGQRATVYPPGTAQRIPAGSKFVFQQHYTPNGSPQDDKTKIGIVFADPESITQETYTIIGINQEFEIPPGSDDHRVQARVRWLPKQGKLLAFSPHMHLRGKSYRLTAKKGDETRVLLDVPNYDFNWQHIYALKEPIPCSEVGELKMEFSFNNSSSNPVNPDAKEFVMWGDQTNEEMAVAFLQVSQPLVEEAETSNADERSVETVSREDPGPSAEVQAKMKATSDAMLADFDKNKDGQVAKSETPWIFRRYQFGQIDHDGDAILTVEEIQRAARWRFE